jgi:redox-sensing transcriptional repressor
MVSTTAGRVCAGERPPGPPATLFLRSQAVTVADAGRLTARVPDVVRPHPVPAGSPGATVVECRVSSPRPRIPEATVARLAVYLRVLAGLADGGRSNVSSGELASAAGVNPAGLRKDLSHLGSCGVRGVGYEVATLRDRIARVLGVERSRPCVLVGIGNLGTALADYAGFGSRGFRFVGLFDAAPARVGVLIGGQPVRPMAELDEVVAATAATIGVIATPADVAQSVCDRLTAAGVRSILNFAPVALNAPVGVDVRQVDLSVELQVLAFLGQQRGTAAPTVEVTA